MQRAGRLTRAIKRTGSPFVQDFTLQEYVQYSRLTDMDPEVGTTIKDGIDGQEDGVNASRHIGPRNVGQRHRQANQANPEMYLEAPEKYPTDDSIDKVAEKKLQRRLDLRILPILGLCYFFYVC